MCMYRFWSRGPPGWGQRRIAGARLPLSLILHPQSCAGSQGSKRNLGRDGNGLRLRPELKLQEGAQISGAISGSSLTLVQSAPLAQKQMKKENWGEKKKEIMYFVGFCKYEQKLFQYIYYICSERNVQ